MGVLFLVDQDDAAVADLNLPEQPDSTPDGQAPAAYPALVRAYGMVSAGTVLLLVMLLQSRPALVPAGLLLLLLAVGLLSVVWQLSWGPAVVAVCSAVVQWNSRTHPFGVIPGSEPPLIAIDVLIAGVVLLHVICHLRYVEGLKGAGRVALGRLFGNDFVRSRAPIGPHPRSQPGAGTRPLLSDPPVQRAGVAELRSAGPRPADTTGRPATGGPVASEDLERSVRGSADPAPAAATDFAFRELATLLVLLPVFPVAALAICQRLFEVDLAWVRFFWLDGPWLIVVWTIWLFGGAVVVIRSTVGYLRRVRMGPLEAELELNEQVWRELRRELGHIGRRVSQRGRQWH